MKRALLLIVLVVSVGFVSRAFDCFELACTDPLTVTSIVGQLGWKLWEALL